VSPGAIAAQHGLSVTTVSRVLGGVPGVSAATRVRAVAGVALPRAPVRSAQRSEATGFTLMQAPLAERTPPTAVLYAACRVVIRALHAIFRTGLHTGQNISLTGQNVLPAAGCTGPPSGRIEQFTMRAGERIFELLTELLHGTRGAQLTEVGVGPPDHARLRRAGAEPRRDNNETNRARPRGRL
jgi:DNA-binding LacI/PurR family transcriptional regulator